ncbi:uncharacterized protein B0H18DRAFT_1121304 [Fomitopsis serialis]|uniref:uncharacterized protein n=1 Tax=Fomitopsis serialis TaxID=139415 RepID=UPI0020087180|nr:uncharacterized protein B0H18DRAFT_1121304 [Neoantrodia serialis]KAH9921610.1 hypothetical protein B0H18DRAFT_1121304 [Neoantrodia serialis]
MSGLPPTLNAETGTPAHEWAQSTTTAAFAREDPAPAADSFTPPGVLKTTSTVSTPGHEFPGAYPSEAGSFNTQAFTEAARNAMNTVSTTAQQYLPVAQETAAQAAQRAAAAASQATQTASSYLSNTSVVDGSTVRASTADDPHQTSLPSTETTGGLPQEHVGGAGALPAASRRRRSRSSRRAQREGRACAISPIAGSAVPATAAFTALAPSGEPHAHPQATSVTLRDSLPSQEAAGQSPYTHQDGAGALPGRKREQGVAVLPDESGGPAGATAATSAATGAQPRDWSANPALARPGDEAGNESRGLRAGRDVAGGVGSLGGKGDKLAEMDQAEREARYRSAGTQKPAQKPAAADKVSVPAGCVGPDVDDAPKDGDAQEEDTRSGRETQMNLLSVNLQPRTHPLGTADAAWRGVGVGVDSGYADGEGVDIGRRPGVVESPSDEGNATKEEDGAPAEGGEKAKKATFMEKMKGEAKVVMGKLEGKKGVEKVQEGKKLKGARTVAVFVSLVPMSCYIVVLQLN